MTQPDGRPGSAGDGRYQPLANGRRPQEPRASELWHILRRNPVLAVGLPLLIVLAATGFVLLATPIYESYVSIRVDESRPGDAPPMLDILSVLSSGNEVETEMEVLRSRTLAEQVVEELALQVRLDAPRRVPRSTVIASISSARSAPAGDYVLRRQEDAFRASDAATGRALGSYGVAQPIALPGVRIVLRRAALEHDELRVTVQRFEEAVTELRRTLGVSRPNREADIILVRYEGDDPRLVQAVPNALAAAFIASRDQVRTAEARSTVAFLGEQLDSLSLQLGVAEEELRTLREGQNMIAPQAQAEAQVSRLIDMTAERDLLDAERAGLQEMLARVEQGEPTADGESPLRRLTSYPTLLRNPAIAELLRSLSDLENRRSELLVLRLPEDPDVQVLTQRVREIERQLANIAITYLEGLSHQITSLDARLAQYGGELQSIPSREVQYARLERQATIFEDIFTLLQTRLKEAQIAAAIEDPSVRIIDPAALPFEPFRPNKPLTIGLALALGLMLGAGGAVVRERMDTSVRTRQDLQLATGGLPVLGLIPSFEAAPARMGFLRRTGRPAERPGILIAERDPTSPAAEAYRALRTNIAFSRIERPPRTLVLSSAEPGEGKSTTTANLAVALAQQGARVLLIDADLRRGALHELFGQSREPGLSNVLLGRVSLDAALQTVELSGGTTLHFLPNGALPPNPAELLASDAMRRTVREVEDRYDAIILDAPPLNLVTDAAVLGARADGVILVARAGVTSRQALAFAHEQLDGVHASVLGTLLNDADGERDTYYRRYDAS